MQTTKTYKVGPYKIEVKLNLKGEQGAYGETFKKPIFSAYANIYSGKRRERGGQCLDAVNIIILDHKDQLDAAQLIERQSIYTMRQRHHQNGLHAGTERQENRLNKNGRTNRASDYSHICEILKQHHLLTDKGYKFGTAWLYRPIPDADLKIIKALIKD